MIHCFYGILSEGDYNVRQKFFFIGIDVGSAFSFMTLLALDGSVIQKPFKITYNKLDSLEKAVSLIKKAEELHSLESHTFLESTGIYHFPLFCYLVDCGFHVSTINPIITHSSKNGYIEKVKNDKVDSKGISWLGLSDDIPVSQFPAKLVLEIHRLTRKYYDLIDERATLASTSTKATCISYFHSIWISFAMSPAKVLL